MNETLFLQLTPEEALLVAAGLFVLSKTPLAQLALDIQKDEVAALSQKIMDVGLVQEFIT